MAFWSKRPRENGTRYVYTENGVEYDVTKEVKQIKDKGLGFIGKIPENKLNQLLLWANQTTIAYGEAGKTLESGELVFIPISALPYSKKDMKIALKVGVFLNKIIGDHDTIEAIRATYSALSMFQPYPQATLDKMTTLLKVAPMLDDKGTDANEIAMKVTGDVDELKRLQECLNDAAKEGAYLNQEINRLLQRLN